MPGFNGKSYDADWYPIDAMGVRQGDKDWQANRDWAQQNDPAGAWNFSPEIKKANPVAWDKTPTGIANLNNRTPTPGPQRVSTIPPPIAAAPPAPMPDWMDELFNTPPAPQTPQRTVGGANTRPTRGPGEQPYGDDSPLARLLALLSGIQR